MIAIGLLFVRMLCDCFKPRQQLQRRSWCCGINSTFFGSVRHRDRICVGLTVLCSSGSTVGWRVTSNHNSCRRPWLRIRNANNRSKVRVGTTQINGGDRLRVVAKERLPALRGRPTPVASEKSDSFVTVM